MAAGFKLERRETHANTSQVEASFYCFRVDGALALN